MTFLKINSLLLSFTLIVFSCSDDSFEPGVVIQNPTNASGNSDSTEEWLIPSERVLDGGVGFDGIPSIDNPNFTNASDVNFLDDRDLVLGIAYEGEIKAYPHPILDWHEIVNDKIGDIKLAVTYCPLTGTGVGWNRVIDGNETEFGVSGLLFNTNLMPYDRNTGSIWSQQRLDCVNGELIGQKAVTHSLIEMPWGTWRQAFPNSQVMNESTGFSRDYDRYPYNDYRTNDERLLFPIQFEDDRLPFKERVLGVIIAEDSKTYPFDLTTSRTEVIEDNVGGTNIVVVRNTIHNYLVAFTVGNQSGFEAIQNDLPFIMRDGQGNKYDLLGRSSRGTSLELPTQFVGYWFSWGTFYQDIDIYGE